MEYNLDLKNLHQNCIFFNHHKVSWIYFGCSYLKMKNWEEKMSIKRTNLQKNIHFQAEKQKRPFLEWIESKNKLSHYEDVISEINIMIEDPLFLSIKYAV